MTFNATTAQPLIAWYNNNRRTLPFREVPSAYHIWISEIMLQQTQMATVLPYYERFIQQLPTINALANCPDDILHKLWEGLGYYSRVRNMKKTAIIVMQQYNGIIPADYNTLLSLPGIGPYTAGAIASIAFNQPYVAVDGNVLRVFSRLLADNRNMKDPKVKKEMSQYVQQMQPVKQAGDFNQAVMELGALICTPTSPKCFTCPLNTICMAFKQGTQTQFPVKEPKKAKPISEVAVFIIHTPQGTLLHKRDDTGLLAGLWEPLTIETEKKMTKKQAETFLSASFPNISLGEPLPNAKHIFTHRIWRLYGWEAQLKQIPNLSKGYIYTNSSQIKKKYSIPSAFKTYMPFLLQDKNH